MISCNLKGGIGNIMFQIAALEYLGSVNNLEVGYYNVDDIFNRLNNDSIHNPKLDHSYEYLNMFKNFKWNKCNKPNNIINIPFCYVDIDVSDNFIYDGFFQSEKYFPDREFILNLFEASEFVIEKLYKYKDILKGNTCSIHVRRGDYLKFPMHYNRDINYYEKAISEVVSDKYIIFSDDMEWCKLNFIGDRFHFIENEKDYIEIFLQSICKNNIISSSSFSWWGAWLNKNINKKVVGPKEWFAVGETNLIDKDILPDNWVKI